MRAATQSNGKAGEDMARIAFRRQGWQMWKIDPPSRVIRQGGSLKVIYTEKGYPDFMGKVAATGMFRACEVKEATREDTARGTMPASRLSKSQREFLNDINIEEAYTGILWTDDTFDLFPFIDAGSYKKGKGIR